jgi:hypothetical protein
MATDRKAILSFRSSSGITSAFLYFSTYAFWTVLFKLAVKSLIIFALLSSSSRTPRYEEINEAYSANELSFMGLGSFLYVALLRALEPLCSSPTLEIFPWKEYKNRLLPGILQGFIWAGGLIGAFSAIGVFRYLGFFLQFDEATLAVVSLVLRILALASLAYFEEFIFRRKILKALESVLPFPATVGVVSILFCVLKMLQADVGWMQLITLFLLSISLTLKASRLGSFTFGAGFWASLLILMHPVFSLPLFGDEFSGLILLKYQGADLSFTDECLRVVTGGLGGPLAGVALQLLLIFDIGREVLRYKLIHTSSARNNLTEK